MAVDYSKPKSDFRSYLIFWSGQQVSQIGSSIVQFAIIWWITITTQSGFYLALSSLIGVGTQLLTQLVAGAVADRFDRKKIILITDMGQASVTGYLMYLFYIGNPDLLFVFIILGLRGLFGGFHQPATNAIIPVMVPKDRLKQMNSIANMSSNILSIFSPMISALILAIFGLDNMYYILAIDLVTFLFAAVTLVVITIPKITTSQDQKQTSFSEDLTMGWRFIIQGPGLLTLLMVYAMINFFLSASMALLPLIVSSEEGLGGDEFTLATAFALLQVGGIVMSLLFSRRSDRLSLLKGVFFGILTVTIGLATAGYTAINQSSYGFFGAILMIGVGLATANIHSRTIWQTHVPLELQGRVMSVRIALSGFITPVSLVVFGILSELILPAYIMLLSGIVSTILFVIAWYGTSIQQISDNLLKSDAQRDEMEDSRFLNPMFQKTHEEILVENKLTKEE